MTYNFKEPTNRSLLIVATQYLLALVPSYLYTSSSYGYSYWFYIHTHHMCIHIDLYPTGRPRLTGCLIFIGHFPQKSPIISGSSVKNDLQLKACCGSLPPCIYSTSNLYLIYIHQWPSSSVNSPGLDRRREITGLPISHTSKRTNKQTNNRNNYSA